MILSNNSSTTCLGHKASFATRRRKATRASHGDNPGQRHTAYSKDSFKDSQRLPFAQGNQYTIPLLPGLSPEVFGHRWPEADISEDPGHIPVLQKLQRHQRRAPPGKNTCFLKFQTVGDLRNFL